ncbi:MAG: response regulator transcription factor [Dehalococcoidia bacterium]
MKKRTSIMVVDDEQAIRNLLSRILESEGYSVVGAADGESALALLERQKPDLAILDIMMPGLNGFQVLDLIRQHSNIPVIMLTAKREVTALRDAVTLGADDYVRKPFSTRELLARVQAKLRRVRPAGTVLVERGQFHEEE